MINDTGCALDIWGGGGEGGGFSSSGDVTKGTLRRENQN